MLLKKIRFLSVGVAALTALLLTACGESEKTPEQRLKAVRIDFVQACTFYAGSKNSAFCTCAFGELVNVFGEDTMIRLGSIADESELTNPDDLETFRAIHEFAATTPEGACKDLVKKDAPRDPDRKTFFQRIIEK